MFPFMVDSIVVMMKHTLGDEFSEKNKAAWREVFECLVVEIVSAQKKVALEAAAKNKEAVLKSWAAFGEQNFREGGTILFRQ